MLSVAGLKSRTRVAKGELRRSLTWTSAWSLLAIGTVGCLLLALLGHTFYVDPFSGAGQAIPLVIVVVLAALMLGLRSTGIAWGSDLAALLVGGWVSFFGASQLHGTPYPFGGMAADIARFTALSTRLQLHIGSADELVKGLPSEYPPLFPWIVGKVAFVSGIPAWRLMGLLSVVYCGVAVVIAYLLWRRLFAKHVAVVIAAVPAAVYGDPRKAHEVMAVSVLTAWAAGAFGRWSDGQPRLAWPVAGLVGGLLVIDYQGYLAFSALGLVAIVVMGLLRRPRLPYLRHLALTTVTALVVASWFLGPWLGRLLVNGGENIDDTARPFEAADSWHLPWMHPWPIACAMTTGAVLLVVFCRSQEWARCLTAIAGSAMVYRWVMFHRYSANGHTGFFQYTGRLYDGVLLVGCVLGLMQIWRMLAPSLPDSFAPFAGVTARVALAGIAGLAMGVYWDAQRLGHPSTIHTANFARLAHATALPDGSYPRFSFHVWPLLPAFPYPRLRSAIDAEFGRNALPVLLSYHEAVSSYYPYYQYLGIGAHSSNSLSFWSRREADVIQLSQISDPAAFADRAAHMRYGPIDAFVLIESHKKLSWGYDIYFHPSQFAPDRFHAVRLSPGIWLFTRVGAVVEHHAYPR